MTVRENLEHGRVRAHDRAGDPRPICERVSRSFPGCASAIAARGTPEWRRAADGRDRPRADELRPRLLLLDEPSLGLAPILVDAIFEVIREINTKGTTILLIEQNALLALKTASRGYVLETGSVVLAGASSELAASPDVQKAYLGM